MDGKPNGIRHPAYPQHGWRRTCPRPTPEGKTMSLKQQLADEAIKATPAASTLTLTVFGVPISTWASILSIIVLLVQLFFMLKKNLWDKKDDSTEEHSDGGGSRSGPDRRVHVGGPLRVDRQGDADLRGPGGSGYHLSGAHWSPDEEGKRDAR
ncbi:holin [Ralstonia phage phiAp1]|uniref:Holin n=1 Tax=Ralstonia phage phiAp1 TaxID=2783867 RepID=A0A1L7DS70_9CAUD|nr:holin [Ralstonia phage phiAp1]APU03191.1 holin [Ralstonia phage phiAp1]